MKKLSIVIAIVIFSSNVVSNELFEKGSLPPIIYILLDDQIETIVDPPVYSSGAFLETDGLVVIEMESLDFPTGWQQKAGDGSIGSYLEWIDPNQLNTQGVGMIRAKLVISNPGIYQFAWRNSIRAGDSTTDSNDSWLKILADNFYGFRAGDGSVVCPVGQPSSNRCVGRNPEGSSGNGWFKVYRSGGSALDWSWSARTSDSDAHIIFAQFDQPGEYDLQVSARSKNHAIDRLVLFRALNDSDNLNFNFATDSNRSGSARVE